MRSPGHSQVPISLRPPYSGTTRGLIPILRWESPGADRDSRRRGTPGSPAPTQHQDGPHGRAGPRPGCDPPVSYFPSQLFSLGAPGLRGPIGQGMVCTPAPFRTQGPHEQAGLGQSNTEKQEAPDSCFGDADRTVILHFLPDLLFLGRQQGGRGGSLQAPSTPGQEAIPPRMQGLAQPPKCLWGRAGAAEPALGGRGLRGSGARPAGRAEAQTMENHLGQLQVQVSFPWE